METPKPASEGITRRDLELVIRRAVELAAVDADAQDNLTEAEVVRIASELGLPARHVRQALYELPAGRGEPALLDRLCGPATVSSTRVVPGDRDLVYHQLEEHLVTRELLQLQRRQAERAWFAPADDAISNVTRGLFRNPQKHPLACSRSVVVAVQPIEAGSVHVHLELDPGYSRRARLIAGGLAGSTVGVVAGLGVAAVIGVATGDVLATSLPIAVAQVVFVGGSAVAGLAAGGAAAASSLRRKLLGVRVEVDRLLDRLERGEPLDPPPAPWRRRLQRGIGRRLRTDLGL